MTPAFFFTLKEPITLLWIHLKVKTICLIEYSRVVFHYYSHLNFAKIDAALLFSYLFSNPFRISKHFLQEREENDVYTYGETPLTTLELIARKCQITAKDTVFELGCGRGRACFWLNQIVGCAVVGVDYVPSFIEKAEKIKNLFQVQSLSFRLEDFLKTDFKDATVIYLYGTCLSTSQIEILIKRLSALPKETKIITVSYALKDCQPDAPFRVLTQFPAIFTWGETEVYLQEKTD